LVEINEERARAPELAVEEYSEFLADRGDIAKLSNLHGACYSWISYQVQQDNLKQMHSMIQQ
jgi:hypothetical protein